MVPVVRKPHIFQVFQSMVSLVGKGHVSVCPSQWFLWLYNNTFFFRAFGTVLIVASASSCVILKLDNLWLFQPMVSVV